MSRTVIDCRAIPNDVGCTLTISGEPEEVLTAAVHHAVTVHGHTDSPELRELLRGALVPEPAPTQQGAFVQLIDYRTDRPDEWDATVTRWAKAIGVARTARWSITGQDRNQPDHYVEIVEFGSHADATTNSAHPATSELADQLRAICLDEPRFRDLDVRTARRW